MTPKVRIGVERSAGVQVACCEVGCKGNGRLVPSVYAGCEEQACVMKGCDAGKHAINNRARVQHKERDVQV